MKVDKSYCMSSYLTLRYVEDDEKVFADNMPHPVFRPLPEESKQVMNSAKEIYISIAEQMVDVPKHKVGMLLSGGIDSAILAAFMPKGTKAYTSKCKASNAVDETQRAAEIAKLNGLEHVIVDVSWDDYMQYSEALMKHRGAPIHANEPQVYTILQQAKKDGIEYMVFGDNADMAFGGYDGLLSKDWTYDEWIERYTYVKPEKVLKNPANMGEIFEEYRLDDNKVDFIRFMNDKFSVSSTGSYTNAFDLAGIKHFDPFACMRMESFDLDRIRSGESKYLVRELFQMIYPNLEIPQKMAMARAMDVWMQDWKGPTRDEFLPNCIEGMSGEQKWQIFNLEWFLNMIDNQ